jgi:hypothetical protein
MGTRVQDVSSCEYWTIDRVSGAATPQAILSYDTDRCGVIDVPSELVAARWNAIQWDTHGQSSDTGDAIISMSGSDWGVVTLGSVTANNPMDGGAATCAGDFNGDGFRNTTDLLLFLSNFGCTSGCAPYDLSGDDATNTQDLLSFLSVFGIPC